jgi:hypothetical protein
MLASGFDFLAELGSLKAKTATRMARTARTEETVAICTRERDLNMVLAFLFSDR